MEENKKCCESGACEKCTDKKEGACCGGMCHGKCHNMLKMLIPIILIAAAFYVGTLVGCNDDFRERGYGQRYMDEGFGPRENFKETTGDVNVLPETPTPAVTQ